MNVGEVRSFVRTHLDVDEEEYPNALLDAYLDEAFTRTVSLETRWPSYEFSWTVTKPDGDTTLAVPSNLNIYAIDSIINLTTGQRLLEIGPELAEDYLIGATPFIGVSWFTTYGGVIQFWPQVATGEGDFGIRGQRVPTPVETADSFVLDCDFRLHRLICHYVIALMYANQEDEILEEVYMKRWAASYGAVRRAIFTPQLSRPLVLSGGLRYQSRWHVGPAVAWDVS